MFVPSLIHSLVYSWNLPWVFPLSQGVRSMLGQSARTSHQSACLLWLSVSKCCDKWKPSLCMGHLSWDSRDQQESFWSKVRGLRRYSRWRKKRPHSVEESGRQVTEVLLCHIKDYGLYLRCRGRWWGVYIIEVTGSDASDAIREGFGKR